MGTLFVIASAAIGFVGGTLLVRYSDKVTRWLSTLAGHVATLLAFLLGIVLIITAALIALPGVYAGGTGAACLGFAILFIVVGAGMEHDRRTALVKKRTGSI